MFFPLYIYYNYLPYFLCSHLFSFRLLFLLRDNLGGTRGGRYSRLSLIKGGASFNISGEAFLFSLSSLPLDERDLFFVSSQKEIFLCMCKLELCTLFPPLLMLLSSFTGEGSYIFLCKRCKGWRYACSLGVTSAFNTCTIHLCGSLYLCFFLSLSSLFMRAGALSSVKDSGEEKER